MRSVYLHVLAKASEAEVFQISRSETTARRHLRWSPNSLCRSESELQHKCEGKTKNVTKVGRILKNLPRQSEVIQRT